MKQKRKLGRKLLGFLLTLAMVVGLMPGMSKTAQAATTLTDTFVSSTGQTEYIGNNSKMTCGETKDLGIVYTKDKPIIIETLNGEIIDKIVLKSPATNEANHYVYPDHGTVTNEYYNGHAILGDDLLITITDVNATKVNITFGTYTYPSIAYYDTVQVYCHAVPVDITGVELNKTSTILTVGETDTLTATVNPDNSDHTVAWSSDNESVATVSDGVVTAVSKGTANITVTATNGTDDTSDDKTATCTITVEETQEEEPASDEPKEEEPAPDESKEEETTPVTPATDTSINTEVKTAEGAPAIKADNLDNALAEKLLTDAEKAEYANGTPVLVYLDVKEVDKANVPADDVAAIDKVTSESGYTYGGCLDISLWKKMGNGEATQVHDTNGNLIKMTVTVPDSLKAPAGFTRTIRVVRVHKGVATVLAEGTGLTLDFSSDSFSSYFLVYKDTKIEEATNTSVDTSSNTQSTPAPAQTTVAEVPKTGEYMPIAALIMLILSMTGMVMVITGLKKKNHI